MSQEKHLKDYTSPNFTITDIELNFNLHPNKTQVTAKSKIKRLNEYATTVELDGSALKLLSITLDGNIIEPSLDDHSLRFSCDQDEAELVIETEIDPLANTLLEGLYMSDGSYCTQCEAEGFRRITYFMDRPDVLAKYTVRVEAPKAGFPYLLSNGNLIEQGELDNDRHFACWQDPFPKPSYLFALVAGDYDLLEDKFVTRSGREVKLQVFVDKGNLHKAAHAMVSLQKSMKWDEERFDLEYDLDIYMIVAVDFFNMGAMENKGLNIFNTKYVLADKASATDDDFDGIESVIGHEYFHNWTGNRVTCRDWFQLSLKEGLTVFRDQEFSSDLNSRAVQRINAVKVMRSAQFAEDAGPMAHPIRPQSVLEMNNFYTVTVYNKGAEVIRMIHTLIGEQAFQAGMKLYFERFDGQAVTCDDFVDAMADASGRDFSQFRRWYNQAGTPVVDVEQSFDATTGQYQLHFSQSTPATADKSAKEPMLIPVSFELLSETGESVESGLLELTEVKQSFSFDGLKAQPVASLFNEFSAPVKVNFEQTLAEKQTLLAHSANEFSRWDAAQSLMTTAILSNLGEVKVLDQGLVSALEQVLTSELDDHFKAEVLTLPALSILSEAMDVVDVDALVSTRKWLKNELAQQLQSAWLANYQGLLSVDGIGARALKNLCLDYLSFCYEGAADLITAQYQSSQLMTDTLAALQASTNLEAKFYQALLADFGEKWQDVPLVMDKWFALQANLGTGAVIELIGQLRNHSAFSIDNPNRVRSLIGSFAMQNMAQFHRIDGAGYKLLTDTIIELNTINPQVAARIITPLTQFKRFDAKRQQMMVSQLERIAELPELAKDLQEKVSKALEQ
ncbi:aminopeptidase N [Paraferrimonas sp. SM1919]|uniref:aminopeptidase N n=1 Tax=Paraferrimonas sp. SM1919 TaxID=2662263 RepID=UPI0013D594D5|nr:aminopeptidase N [Paraferrimonas sp. SM1919]